MSDTSYFNLHGLVIEPGNHREMLFNACINCSRNKFLHLLSAAYHRYLLVYYFLYYIAAMRASIKSCCHILIV